MLLPMTLPSAMPGWLSSAAWALMNSSGLEVPYATTVRPTTSFEIPNSLEIPMAPRTRASPPRKRRMRPPMICKVMIMGWFL